MAFPSRILLLFSLFAGGTSLWSQSDRVNVLSRKYSPAQLREDALVMKNAILKIHPVIGIYHPRSYYNALFDVFIASIRDSMTEKQFRIRIKIIMDELHCGHTEAISSKEYIREFERQKLPYSPYVFMPLGKKVYILAVLGRKKDSTGMRGIEVRKINGVPVDTMLTVCSKIISTDGNNLTGKDYYLKLGFNSFYPALFGRPDTFRIEYYRKDTLRKLSYVPLHLKKIPSLPIAPKEDSTMIKYRRASMKHQFLDKNHRTFYLKLHSFSRRRYTKAYRKVFRQMKREGVENLVLDLRNNGGGSLENAYHFLSYVLDKKETQTLWTGIKNYPDRQYVRGNAWFRLMRFGFSVIAKHERRNDTDRYVYTIKPRKRNHFNGKIKVLINGGSFSASCLVSAYLKSTGRALFIGEETSGTAEGCNAGITPFYKLPNTRIKIRVPAFRVIHDVSPAFTGRGIMPDVPVTYTFDDVLKRRDLELEKVKVILNIQ